ncbi:alanine racemase [Egicoccus halophilus]|uniref:Alanine racemase n=1 Tax=Egicoccus halophilus TaxID=1670830 RepID=A0A8J3A7Z4_9ACTN|nr:alanine racemase [Egicoccus halophilus]GGI05899.1 alanine racemase [Egicoccus halophilus]
MRAHRPTRIEVSTDAVRHNAARLAALAGTEVCAVVKADGYGHGAAAVARAALAGGASTLAVALVEEGLALRAAGIDAPVLVLAEPPVDALPTMVDAALTPTVYREATLDVLDRLGRQRGTPVGVHLKVDTGMGRVGVPEADWDARLRQAVAATGLRVEAVYTHLARADEPAADTTRDQLAVLERFLRRGASAGLPAGVRVHTANSAATLLHPAARRDLVRPGIALYGLSPAPDVDAAAFGLRPALRLVTEVSFAKRIPAGTAVSYGHRWVAPADGWLATLPLGYADGVPRALTNVGVVLIDGRRRPVAGTVCMDQLLVWCGDDEVAAGDEAVLIGTQGDEQVRVEEWAAHASTITYEIVTQLTARVPRVVDPPPTGRPDHPPT